MAILGTLESTALDNTISCVSKLFILLLKQTNKRKKPQNLKLVNVKYVTYT